MIRPASEADLGDLLALYQEMAEEAPVKMPADPLQAGPVLKGILADQSRHLHVAVIGNQVVGSGDLLIVPNLPHHARPWAVIENVIVTAPARRRGVASALMHHLVEIASSAGCYKVQLMSGKQRMGAHELYRKIGFHAVADGFKIFFDGTQAVRPDQ